PALASWTAHSMNDDRIYLRPEHAVSVGKGFVRNTGERTDRDEYAQPYHRSLRKISRFQHLVLKARLGLIKSRLKSWQNSDADPSEMAAIREPMSAAACWIIPVMIMRVPWLVRTRP